MLSYSQSSDSGQLRQTYSKSNLKQRREGSQENPGGWRDSYIDILFMRYDQRLEISEFIFALLVFKPIRRHLPSPFPSPLPPKKKKGNSSTDWLLCCDSSEERKLVGLIGRIEKLGVKLQRLSGKRKSVLTVLV